MVEAEPVREVQWVVIYEDTRLRALAQQWLEEGRERSWIRAKIGGQLFDNLMSSTYQGGPYSTAKPASPAEAGVKEPGARRGKCSGQHVKTTTGPGFGGLPAIRES